MELELEISPKKMARALAAVIVLLATGYVASWPLIISCALDPRGYFGRFLDLNAESNPAALFSGALLLADSAVLAFIAGQHRARSEPWSAWAGLCAVFAALAFDEWLSVHELSNLLLAGSPFAHGFLYYSWVVFGLLFVAIFAAAYARFWWRLPPRTRLRFAVAAVLLAGGAVAVEAVGGMIEESKGRDTLPYMAEVLVEECAEMGGATLFLYALLDHVRAVFPAARLRLSLRR